MIVNECFVPFKDLHKGKTGIVIGCGPTAGMYDGSKHAIHIGCNELIYSEKLSLDYYFIGDAQVGWPDKQKTFFKDPEAYNSYKPNIAKFVRNHPQPDCNILDCNSGNLVDHALHYNIAQPGMALGTFDREREKDFQVDITKNYMYSRLSISFEMMQFALWTGLKRLYLVGHDCSYAQGTLYNPDHRAYDGVPRKGLVDAWLGFKKWSRINYPDVDIMCVNPVAMNHFDHKLMHQIIEN